MTGKTHKKSLVYIDSLCLIFYCIARKIGADSKIDFNQYAGNGYQSTRSVPRKCYYGIKQPTIQYHPYETPVPIKLHKKWY